MATKKTRTSKPIAGKAAHSPAKKIRKARKRTPASPQYKDLHELLVLKLQSLYDIEAELIKVLPKFAKAAASYELKEAFQMHLQETKSHILRLEDAMQLLNIEPKKEKVAGIRGIAEDGDRVAGRTTMRARDAALIAAAQYAEHYEMAGYAAAREWAAMMDHPEVADLLDATLSEERAASERLTELAHNGINQRAGGISMEEEAEEVDTVVM